MTLRSRDIAIIGAGISGITTAQALSNNIQDLNVEIFEARDRVGGRINSTDGAELIDQSNQAVQNLADRNGVELINTYAPNQVNYRNVIDTSTGALSVSDVVEDLKAAAADFKFDIDLIQNSSDLAKHLATTPLIDYLASKPIGEIARSALMLHQLQEHGLEPTRLSALRFLESAVVQNLLSDKSFYQAGYGKYTVKGGTSVLTDSIAHAIEKNLPIKLDSAIEAINILPDGRFELAISSTPSSPVITDKLVLTIPFGVLRDIEGVLDLPIAQGTRELISSLEYGTNGKYIVTAAGPQAQKLLNPEVNEVLSADAGGAFWVQSQFPERTEQVQFSVFQGGERAEDIQLTPPAYERERILLAIERVYGKIPEGVEVSIRGVNWAKDPYSLGSFPTISVQSGSSAEQFEQSHVGGKIIFAGDFDPRFPQGYIEGAVESALAAADLLLEK